MIRTLVVDDSPLVRAIIKDFLESDDSFLIVGESENGEDSIKKARELDPDLITMDIEMPVMNGLDAIVEIKKNPAAAAIIVITTIDTAKMAYDATVRGAAEFFAKDLFTSQMSEEKRDKIIKTIKHIVSVREKAAARQEAQSGARGGGGENAQLTPRQIKVVVIAASTGGPNMLSQLCDALPENFPVPIVLVQHNLSGFDRGFVQWLDGYTPLNVCLAEEGMIPEKGRLYVAPTDKHLLLDKKGFIFDDGEPISNQKPAADLLFKSAADLYGEAVVSVVLTGMGSDGAEGTRYIKNAGGITIAQDEATSMVYGMPQAAAETGCIDMVLPMGKIAGQLLFFSKVNK